MICEALRHFSSSAGLLSPSWLLVFLLFDYVDPPGTGLKSDPWAQSKQIIILRRCHFN